MRMASDDEIIAKKPDWLRSQPHRRGDLFPLIEESARYCANTPSVDQTPASELGLVKTLASPTKRTQTTATCRKPVRHDDVTKSTWV
jgi:hypothetical protein